ncbi:uncharacterized protein LOC107784693 [Nicotiana tabacum]|uniref:Uncharacterized protein LOC107784693 n=1 Tax=Nicotiana tabacum TaxID=4097 RepID=A0A1S3ZAT7_TOBAC|nr:PREDICTED: uncharacterized protein LOC107784693 [Nicotiana tabacum]
MDLEVKRVRKKRVVYNQPKIKCGALTKAKAQGLRETLLAMGAWRNSGDVSSMWTMIANCIREVAREVLGVSKCYSGGHKGDWWWNEEVQGKVEAKKEAYLKLVGSTDKEEQRTCMERYKLARKEAKLAVMTAKTASFERLYKDIGGKRGDKNMYKLAKIRERKAWDLDQVWCIKDEDSRVLVEEAEDRNIVLGELENSRSQRDFRFCRRIRSKKDGGQYGKKMPDEWWWSLMIPLYKNKGDIQDCNNYMYRKRKKNLHMVSIDLEKTYAKVSREVLWRFMEVSGAPVAYIIVIKDMYKGVKTRIRTVKRDLNHFPVEMGCIRDQLLAHFFALALEALT